MFVLSLALLSSDAYFIYSPRTAVWSFYQQASYQGLRAYTVNSGCMVFSLRIPLILESFLLLDEHSRRGKAFFLKPPLVLPAQALQL